MHHSKRGKPTIEAFGGAGVDPIQLVLDEFCRDNLTESAYKKVMKESMTSERKRK